jgi:hypothetical protein
MNPFLLRSLWTFVLALGVTAAALAAEPAARPPAPKAAEKKATPPPEPPLSWHDVTRWGVEGRAFDDMERKRWFDRLPAAADGKVTTHVWNLSRDSAGMMVRFKTDATTLWADYTLHKERLAGANMTAIGASGIDLYARDDSGRWRWVGVTRPDKKIVRQEIVSRLRPGLREYAAYLPLYNGVENLSIGVPPDAKFEPLPPRAAKPIVFYGTSITHGASASRPGMVHTAILGRRFDRPVVNLGFSGNGRMDAEVGEFLTRIDAAVFVIDCLPNMSAELVRQKCIPLVKQLRAARPETPIVLVEDRRNTNSWILPARNKHHTDNHAALRKCYETLQREGVKRLHYIRGDDLLGHDDEATTDGSHPSDLGFVRQADVFEPVLRAALGGS